MEELAAGMGVSATEIKSAGEEVYQLIAKAPTNRLGGHGPQYALTSWDKVVRVRHARERAAKEAATKRAAAQEPQERAAESAKRAKLLGKTVDDPILLDDDEDEA